MAKKKLEPFLYKTATSFLLALFVIIITQDIFFTIEPLKRLESRLTDERFKRRGNYEIKDSSDVIILEITQETYDQIPSPYNSWPWPRSYFAKIIENLSEAGVRAIGIDLVMSNTDQFDPADDSILFETISNTKNVVVAGKVNTRNEAVISESGKTNKGVITKQKANYGSLFFEADSSIGIVQVINDFDGVHRRYRPFVYSFVTETKIPSFGFALLNKYYGEHQFYTCNYTDEHFVYHGKVIPRFDRTSILINFYGPARTFPHYKFINVLDDKDFKTTDEIELEVELNTWDDPDYGLLHSGIFRDKIVIIGSTMPEDKDLLPVSISKGEQEGDNVIYGVEFYANIIQNIIWNDFIEKQSQRNEIILIIILSVMIFFITSFLKEVKSKLHLLFEVVSIAIAVIGVFVVYELGVYLFINNQYLISIISPSFAIIIGYFGSIAYHFVKERKQNQLIKGMFGTYVSKELVNQLLADPDKLKLGGEQKNLTIMFSDIAGFTPFSEGKQPEEVVNFVNEFLTEMTEIINNNKGTLDKYLGDAVMAFWGAPIDIRHHHLYACKSAIQMQEKLNELNKRWSKTQKDKLKIRIGINSGEVVVGNIGGENRFDYTVMGDNVNLTSRLEGANKLYNTSIMMSHETYINVKELFHARELDIIRVKGKSEPTKVYELIGDYDDENAKKKMNRLKDYFKGLDLYKQKRFNEAAKYFIESIEKYDDEPSKVYMKRCGIYIDNPPDKDWDGVFVMTTK
ncbi:MAG: adenylate/guanylate cyclase domain-containing protein [Ignavibacteria bacterium]|jgi:adenylate cyclase